MDHSGGGGPPPPPKYPLLIDPYSVMHAYQLAYQARDSVEMKLLYDNQYVGTSTDQSSPGGPVTSTFSKADEVSSVGAMAKKITITSVSLGVPSVLTRLRDDADPPGWALIQFPVGLVTLKVDDGQTTHVIIPDKESFEFRFAPMAPDSTSPTDTTWKIIRWRETIQLGG